VALGAVSPVGQSNPYLAAEGDAKKGVKSPEFLCGNTLSPIPTRYCLPYDLVKQVALYFLETGDRSPNIGWEEI
jgi:hypothetical protein